MGATILSNEGSTVGIKAMLAALSPIGEELDGIGLGLVDSNGDALCRGGTVKELKGAKGGSLEPVRDGSDMLDSDRFSGHRYGLVLLYRFHRINFYDGANHITHGRGKDACTMGGRGMA